MTQEQLNNHIAEDLNKWQPIIEYARIFLDEDKALRDKYKWLLVIKDLFPWSLGLSLLSSFFPFISNQIVIFILMGVFFSLTIVAVIIIYRKRDTLSKFINKKDREELVDLIDSASRYISKLSRWLTELDSHIEVNPSDVFSIEKLMIESQTEILIVENKFSRIHGNLVPEWDARAKKIARKRLQPLKQFIYE
ncbi:MAG: hypothetical protein IKO20_09245 [Bacteroidaceae bacterium]|nr:hypothetical protein [Bacteroidaceae bacterium]